MNKKKYVEIINNRFNKLSDKLKPILEEVKFYQNLYYSAMTNTEGYLWDYNLVDPVIFYLIRSVLSRLNTESMNVKLIARNQEAESKRKINQKIIDWEFGEINRNLVFYNFLFRGLIAGRAYLKTCWKYEPAIKISLTDEEGNKQTKVLRNIVNRADIINIRFEDLVIPNQEIPEIEEQPYIIERIIYNYADLLNEAKNNPEYWDIEAVEKIKKKNLFISNVDDRVKKINQDETEDNDLITKAKYVEVLRMQTKDNEVYYIVRNSDDILLNKDLSNPYWHGHYPYISWTPFPEDNRFYSMGIVQPVADLAVALTSVLNQYLTNARKSANPMWIAGSAAAQTPDWQFISRPDGIIRVVGDVNQVVQVRPIDTSDTLLRLRQEIMTSFERTSAMSSFYSTGVAGGTTPQINKTATGAKIIDANIDTNMQMLISLFSSMTLKKVGEHFLELNAQYIREEQEIKIAGKDGQYEFIKVSPEEITANFDCYVNPDVIGKVSTPVRQAQLMNLKSLIDAERDVKINKKAVWKQILNAFPEMDAITDDLIIDAEQQAKEAIELLLQGIEPKIELTQDHLAILQLVQVFIMSNPDLPNGVLLRFNKYIDDLSKYVVAKSNIGNLIEAKTNEIQQAKKINRGQGLPVNEADLMKTLTAQNQMATNPTEGLQNKIKEPDLQG